MKKFFLALTIYFISINSLFALIKVDITRGNLDPLPIAVSPLHIDSKSKDVKYNGKIIKKSNFFIYQTVKLRNSSFKYIFVIIYSFEFSFIWINTMVKICAYVL